eukprot:9264515-Pyramimonas_sp.AAC.1
MGIYVYTCTAGTSESSGSQSQRRDGNITDAGANHSAAMGIYLHLQHLRRLAARPAMMMVPLGSITHSAKTNQ